MLRSLLALALLAISLPLAAQEITLRHAVEGKTLDALATLVVRFNDEQKGRARLRLESAEATEDKGRLPTLALLDPQDAGRFFAGQRPRFRSLAEAMKEGGEKWDEKRIFPQLAEAVGDASGALQALPLAMTLPVLFVNRDALARAGLEGAPLPRTWWQLQQTAGAMYEAGVACPLTTSRFAWIHLENIAAQAGVPLSVRSGGSERSTLNGMVNVKHIALLASWHKSRYFHWFGPRREGEEAFARGECAMLTGDSSAWFDLQRHARFPVLMSELPYYDDVYGARPGHVLPDGMSLWLPAGARKEETRVAVRFINFLLRPDNQRLWVRSTGYLPMTAQAMDELRSAGVPAPLIEAAKRRLTLGRKGGEVRNGFARSRIRTMLDEEIEFVWSNDKPAKEALDTAVMRAVRLSPAAFEPLAATAYR